MAFSAGGLSSRDALRRQRLLVATAVLGVIVGALVFAVPAGAWAKTSTRMSISASAKSATIYRKVTLTGTLRTGSGRRLASRTVRLERYSDGTWKLVKKLTTNSRGQALVRLRPADDQRYRFRFAGNSTYRPSKSSSRLVGGYKAPTHTVSGSGTNVAGPVYLEAGLSVFSCTPAATESNFIVWLTDAGGEDIELLANEIGTVPCTKATNIPKSGLYYLEVQSDTSWTVIARQPRQLSAPATRSFSGYGSNASGLFAMSQRAYQFTWSNTGSSNFIVWLLDRDGRPVDLIANEIGSSSGSTLVSIPASSQYIIDIQADGPWTLSCGTL